MTQIQCRLLQDGLNKINTCKSDGIILCVLPFKALRDFRYKHTLIPKNFGRFNFGRLIFGQKISDQNLKISDNFGQTFRTNCIKRQEISDNIQN